MPWEFPRGLSRFSQSGDSPAHEVHFILLLGTPTPEHRDRSILLMQNRHGRTASGRTMYLSSSGISPKSNNDVSLQTIVQGVPLGEQNVLLRL
jgi:hypothetical protein